MTFFILIILGYLIGSFSPGYFFGKIIKNIDIRKFGNGNTGAMNTYRLVGPIYGIITAIFDFLKAPFIYCLSLSGLTPDLAIFPGLAAVVGHIFPFYLGFRGGRGMASLYGLCLTTIIFTQSVFALLLIVGTAVYGIILSEKIIFEAPLRHILKLLALVLPLGLIWLPKTFVLIFVAVLLAIFLIFDLLRFLMPHLNMRYLHFGIFAKQKEKNRLSGATLILLSALLIFFFFAKEIAILSFTCFLLADTLAPIGRVFLPFPFIKDKTLGGAVITFLASLVTGVFLSSLTPLDFSLKIIIINSFLITAFDQLSFAIDDNLLVPLGTAMGLYVAIYFL